MIDVDAILDISVNLALGILSLTFLLTVIRIIRGPTLPDRILALDMLVAAAIGFIAAMGIKTGYYLYVDVAIALGLVGFLATVAFARFVLSRGKTEDELLAELRSVANTERKNARREARRTVKGAIEDKELGK